MGTGHTTDMPGRPDRLVLLDTAGLYFRAFYGNPERDRPPGAPPTNAIRGLLDMIASLAGRLQPTELVACWDDDWRPDFRVAAIPSYKAHRLADEATGAETVPPELEEQIPVIQRVLAALGIPTIGSPGFEADDVIGTLAHAYRGRMPVSVVTGDRDLFQLVDDAMSIEVVYVARGGVRAPDVVDESWLQRTYAIASGPAYADFAVLRGDPSDGLPGVAGIGAKTGAALLAEFGSLAGLLDALDAGDPRVAGATRRRLTEARDYLAVAPRVVAVRIDAPVPPSPYAVPATLADPDAVEDLVRQYALASSIGRVCRALGLDG